MGKGTLVPCAFPAVRLAHRLAEFAKRDPRTEYLEAGLVGLTGQGRQLFLFCGRLTDRNSELNLGMKCTDICKKLGTHEMSLLDHPYSFVPH